MITSLSPAFCLAIVVGVIAGGAVGRLRKTFDLDKNDTTVPAAFIGGIGSAFIFGVAVAFDSILRFALSEKPSPPGDALTFTIFADVLFTLPFFLYRSR